MRSMDLARLFFISNFSASIGNWIIILIFDKVISRIMVCTLHLYHFQVHAVDRYQLISSTFNIDIYKQLPTSGSYTEYTLTQNNIDQTEGRNMCTTLHKFREDFILKHNPSVRIIKLEGSSQWYDFASIVFAPNLLTPSAGSSWFLFAALANAGYIVSPLFHSSKNYSSIGYCAYAMDLSAYPSNFHVSTDVDVLYPPRRGTLDCGLLDAQQAAAWFTGRQQSEC